MPWWVRACADGLITQWLPATDTNASCTNVVDCKRLHDDVGRPPLDPDGLAAGMTDSTALKYRRCSTRTCTCARTCDMHKMQRCRVEVRCGLKVNRLCPA